MKKIYLIAVVLLYSLSWLMSCQDLDLRPTSIIPEEEIYNENGIKAYMAGMYNYLPMEDFKYDTNGGSQLDGGYYVSNGLSIWNFWSATGEMVNRNNVGLSLHRKGYWKSAFQVIRRSNSLIHNLPKYPELATQSQAWIAEAKFLRAYVYFQLAKRYGGLPKIFEAQVLKPSDASTLWVARESHADTYDFILKDLDEAIEKLPEVSAAGRANKYVAAAIKSRVALHAATTARYGSMKFQDWAIDGVLLQGIPEDKANDYFKQAWDAAKLVEKSGRYELHRANMGDRTENYAEIWEKSDVNKESIWLRKYDFNMSVHSYNSVMAPPRMCTESGDRFNPTLDWVELFDGLPLDHKGNFSAFDSDGNYIVYDNSQQLWKNAEPRLRANLLIPGSLYKGGIKLDVRAGIIKEEYDPSVDKFKKFTVDDGKERQGLNSGSVWNKVDYPAGNPFRERTIFDWSTQPSAIQNDPYVRSDGVKIFKNGLDGPRVTGTTTTSNTVTGFFGRKHLDIALPKSETVNFTSTQSWIETRYAEVLLNRAEAAIELAQAGIAVYQEEDMLEDAFKCINDVRDRAGANLLTSSSELSTDPAFTRWDNAGPKGQGAFVEAPNRGLQIVRVERYKELAFESKIYWDLLRWFTYDTQIKQYFRRGLYPIMYAKGATVDENGIPDGKYIYDAKSADEAAGQVTFSVNNYYEGIPTDELKNNPLLQKNRNQ